MPVRSDRKFDHMARLVVAREVLIDRRLDVIVGKVLLNGPERVGVRRRRILHERDGRSGVTGNVPLLELARPIRTRLLIGMAPGRGQIKTRGVGGSGGRRRGY